MDLGKLRTKDAELRAAHPEWTDQQICDDLNAATIQRVLPSLSGDEVFQQTDKAEFGGLNDTKRQLWLAFCGRETIDPKDGANIDFVKWVFGDESQTVTNLAAARTETVSWATSEGYPFLYRGHLENARM